MHIFILVCMQLHLDPFDWVQVQAFIIKSLKLTKAEICVWNLFSTFVKDFFPFKFSCWGFVSHPVKATDLMVFWYVRVCVCVICSFFATVSGSKAAGNLALKLYWEKHQDSKMVWFGKTFVVFPASQQILIRRLRRFLTVSKLTANKHDLSLL